MSQCPPAEGSPASPSRPFALSSYSRKLFTIGKSRGRSPLERILHRLDDKLLRGAVISPNNVINVLCERLISNFSSRLSFGVRRCLRIRNRRRRRDDFETKMVSQPKVHRKSSKLIPVTCHAVKRFRTGCSTPSATARTWRKCCGSSFRAPEHATRLPRVHQHAKITPITRKNSNKRASCTLSLRNFQKCDLVGSQVILRGTPCAVTGVTRVTVIL